MAENATTPQKSSAIKGPDIILACVIFVVGSSLLGLALFGVGVLALIASVCNRKGYRLSVVVCALLAFLILDTLYLPDSIPTFKETVAKLDAPLTASALLKPLGTIIVLILALAYTRVGFIIVLMAFPFRTEIAVALELIDPTIDSIWSMAITGVCFTGVGIWGDLNDRFRTGPRAHYMFWAHVAGAFFLVNASYLALIGEMNFGTSDLAADFLAMICMPILFCLLGLLLDRRAALLICIVYAALYFSYFVFAHGVGLADLSGEDGSIIFVPLLLLAFPLALGVLLAVFIGVAITFGATLMLVFNQTWQALRAWFFRGFISPAWQEKLPPLKASGP